MTISVKSIKNECKCLLPKISILQNQSSENLQNVLKTLYLQSAENLEFYPFRLQIRKTDKLLLRNPFQYLLPCINAKETEVLR